MAAWETVKTFFAGLWSGIVEMAAAAFDWILTAIKPITDLIDGVWSGLSAIGIGSGPTLAAAAGVPMSSQTSTINRSTSSSSTLDVNFGKLPTGATVKQTGSAPGINVNMGRTTSGRGNRE